MDTFQATLDWSLIAPERPADPLSPADRAYRWPASVDAAVREARRNRIRVALLVTRSPFWANGGRHQTWVPRASAYADFVAAASRRYPQVRRWMIWGEPNDLTKFRPNRPGSAVGPRAYAGLLDAAYLALKRESRRNIVIGGMTYTAGTVRPAHFVRFMKLRSGRRPRLDWFGHNPFPIDFPSVRKRPVPGGFRDISDLDTFARQIARAYTHRCGAATGRRCGKRPRLWLSEFLVQSDQPSWQFTLNVSRSNQARWLRAAYEIADRLPSVAGLGWLQLYDERRRHRSAHWGLLTADGQPKPSYFAYRAAPSRAFRPQVRGPRPLRGSRHTRRAELRVRPRAAGRVRVEIRSARGRLVNRVARRLSAGVLWRVRVSVPRLRSERYRVVIDAPRGERVRRNLPLD